MFRYFLVELIMKCSIKLYESKGQIAPTQSGKKHELIPFG